MAEEKSEHDVFIAGKQCFECHRLIAMIHQIDVGKIGGKGCDRPVIPVRRVTLRIDLLQLAGLEGKTA